jgi:2-polyprenyl-3-methyl-5-hydroxy-6-metoxy-1,4-benzoquinol methylase
MLFDRLLSFIKRKVFRQHRERWNHQYSLGNWEGLKSDLEHERFMAAVSLFEKHALGGSILEVGCGEALLQQKLQDNSYTHLLGLDLSDVAIAKAKTLANSKSDYQVANMETFDTQQRFSTVIFTESLNYAKNPVALLKKYQQFLTPNGVIIVSMYRSKHIPKIWESLSEVFHCKDQLVTQNEKGIWDCKVLINK